MKDKLQLEDTVSADRKERIVFDPDAWRKSDKSGKKISAITSRQNFDNEKFTRKAKEEQVDEGLQQTLRKYVPGYAKKQIDKKMDAGKFGKDDVAKDANYWRYKKVQDKLKKEEVEQIDEISLDLAKRARDKAEHMVDMDYDDLRDKPYGHSEKQRVKFQKYVDKKEAKKNVKEEVELDEGTIQPSGDSKVDSAGPTQSDTIAQDKKIKKSNNPQIEFVTGTATPNGSSSTATGNAQNAGIKKISEAIVKKAIAQIKVDKNVGTEEIPFDGPYTKSSADVVDKSGAHHTPSSRARHLARQAMKKQTMKEESELEEGVTGAVAGAVLGGITAGPLGAVAGGYLGHKTQQGANASKAVKKKIVKEEETTMSKTYAEFIEQLNEYNAKDGVYRHKGTYGGSYDSNDDHDDDEPKKPAAPAVKRGRGRPAGSKSGANQKVTSGKSYGGIATHSLHLPNSK